MKPLYPYQVDLLKDVMKHIHTKPVVLAAAPGAGKTEMAMATIIALLKQNPNLKVLILTHGTTTLRNNFFDRLEESLEESLKGKYETIVNANQMTGKPITIAIPQAFKKSVPKCDLLIVDEAHEFYFSKEYGERIRKLSKPKMQLLLTGTHFKFTRENKLAEQENKKHPYHITSITMNEILEQRPEQMASLRILVCQSCYDFTEKDYNDNQDLFQKHKFKTEDTRKTIEKVLRVLTDNVLKLDLAPESRIEKTMIACHNIAQAHVVYKYLIAKGIKSVISVSKSDGDASSLKGVCFDDTQIDEFKKDASIQVLVVVNRGVLGFDFKDLINVVDLTGTRNLSRMYQLMCRAVRSFTNENQKGKEKLFIKVGPHNQGGHEYTLHLMTALLQLNERAWYNEFDGYNFRTLPIPTLSRRERTVEKPQGPVGPQPPRPPSNPKMYLDVLESDLLFDGIVDHLVNNPLAKIGTTTIAKVRAALFGAKLSISNITEENLRYIIRTRKVDERIYG